MPIVLIHHGPSLTQEGYDEVVRRLKGGQGGPMQSPADWPVEGLLVHIAGQGPNGFRVVDVWESEEALRRFGEKLEPILQEVGIEAQPEFYPAHVFVSA